jgi:phosphoesterase RecJ-like protein
MIITEQTITNIKNIIELNKTFAIIVHVNPDGDAIGSAYGWHNLLKNLDKQSNVIAPNDCPEFFKWINDSETMICFDTKDEEVKNILDKADILLCVDFNHIDRTDKVKPLIEAFKGTIVMIDHHPFPQSFASEIISIPEASSTSEISYWAMCQLGYRQYLTKTVAESLYTGILTDTGGMSHNSSNPDTYYAVADLLTCSINKNEIHDLVLNNYPESRIRLLGDILSKNLRVLYQSNTAYMFITEGQQKYFGYRPGDSEGFVNIPLSIKGIKFCAFFTETPDMIKVSLRSKGDFPANKFAAEYFNGGGHFNAAGGKIKSKLFDAMHLFEEGVKAYQDLLCK